MDSKIENNTFDIREKLRASSTTWSYIYLAGSLQKDAGYEFRTIFEDRMEHAIYGRHGSYFVLIDFFKKYDDACEEAKKIIDNYPELKRSLTH